MMKKKIGILLLIFTVVVSLVGCGSSGSAVSIDSDWELESMEVNGETALTSDLEAYDRPIPAFETDGTNITFTNNDIAHTGYLTEDNGVYTLNYNDTDTKMEATISDDVLTVKIVGGTSIFTFKVK